MVGGNRGVIAYTSIIFVVKEKVFSKKTDFLAFNHLHRLYMLQDLF